MEKQGAIIEIIEMSEHVCHLDVQRDVLVGGELTQCLVELWRSEVHRLQGSCSVHAVSLDLAKAGNTHIYQQRYGTAATVFDGKQGVLSSSVGRVKGTEEGRWGPNANMYRRPTATMLLVSNTCLLITRVGLYAPEDITSSKANQNR